MLHVPHTVTPPAKQPVSASLYLYYVFFQYFSNRWCCSVKLWSSKWQAVLDGDALYTFFIHRMHINYQVPVNIMDLKAISYLNTFHATVVFLLTVSKTITTCFCQLK